MNSKVKQILIISLTLAICLGTVVAFSIYFGNLSTTNSTTKATAHVHTEIIDKAVAPTCKTEGKTEGKHCSICKTVTLKPEIIEKLPHTEVIDPAVDPTCSAVGKTEGKHCSVCGDIIVSQKEIEKLQSFNNSVTKLKERAGEIDKDVFSVFFDELRGMSVEDAIQELEGVIFQDPAYFSKCFKTIPFNSLVTSATFF